MALLTPQDRAAAIAAAVGTKTLSFSATGAHGSVSFSVSGCHASGSTVWITVSAWTGTGGNKRFLPLDNPYGFANPPLAVPDGGTDAQGRPTFTRSDLAAAKAVVYAAATASALRLGWAP